MHRGSRHERGYDVEWEKTRERILKRDDYLCQVGRGRGACLIDATQVDHIVAKEDGGTGDDANLQAICTECHGRKTGAERAARRSGARTPGGVQIFGRSAPGPALASNARIRKSENVSSRGQDQG